jgi:hypothetical protein
VAESELKNKSIEIARNLVKKVLFFFFIPMQENFFQCRKIFSNAGKFFPMQKNFFQCRKIFSNTEKFFPMQENFFQCRNFANFKRIIYKI